MPEAYRFRMERILKLRRLREEEARRGLAEAMREVQEQKRRLLERVAERDAGKEELRAGRRKELDLNRLRGLEEWLGALEGRIREEFDLLQDRVRGEIGRRQELTEAGRAVRVLERFRERCRREWVLREERRERRFLDEVATVRRRPS